jgi:hypothetical protein
MSSYGVNLIIEQLGVYRQTKNLPCHLFRSGQFTIPSPTVSNRRRKDERGIITKFEI